MRFRLVHLSPLLNSKEHYSLKEGTAMKHRRMVNVSKRNALSDTRGFFQAHFKVTVPEPKFIGPYDADETAPAVVMASNPVHGTMGVGHAC